MIIKNQIISKQEIIKCIMNNIEVKSEWASICGWRKGNEMAVGPHEHVGIHVTH